MNEIYRIAVIGGAGHVGLPLSLLLADIGHEVLIIDINEKIMSDIRKGTFPFLEVGGSELLDKVLKTGRLSLSSQHKDIRNCDVIILTVGTPIDEHLNPDLDSVYGAIDEIKDYLDNDHVLVFRSTLFPGTTVKILEKLNNEGKNISISFCPERIAQGYALDELSRFPQIISGNNKKAIRIANNLFSSIALETIVLELSEAEIAKLLTNTWRYIKFAVANQFYMLLDEKGYDYHKIKTAISKNYPRAMDVPDAGFAAGPCLFKDTMQLAAFSRHNFALGHSAMLVNETLPDFLVDKAKKIMSLSGTTVGILGMAFKPNNDDKRESLAYKLRRLLIYENATVLCTDPYIKDNSFTTVEKVLDISEIIFIGCPHKNYDSLNIQNKIVIDCWNTIPSQ